MSIRNLLPLLLLFNLAAAEEGYKPPDCATTARLEIRYSPGGGCTEAIIREIDKAKSKILMLAYSFTSETIAKALVRAKSRGLEVQAIIDSGRIFERSTKDRDLAEGRVDVYGDPAHAIQHQKVLIIDPDLEESVLILGSFNFTAAAEKSNSEDSVIIRSHEMAVAAQTNWLMHKEHSKVLAEFLPPAKPSAFDQYLTTGILLTLLFVLWTLCFLAIGLVYYSLKKKK